MASQHILVSSTNSYNARLRSVIDGITAAQNTAGDLKAIFDQTAAGSDFASLAVLLDLSGDSAAADAEAIYNLLGSVITELENDVFLAQLLSRVG